MRSFIELLTLAVVLVGFASTSISDDPYEWRGSQLIVWNVGQGLWTTWSTAEACHHFDAGGERAPWLKINQICSQKLNVLHFSHWDSDHIRFVRQLRRKLPRSCVFAMPAGHGSPNKVALFDGIPTCLLRRENEKLSEIAFEERRAKELPPPPSSRLRASSNDLSRVYVVEDRVLLPGDSPKAAERYWSNELSINARRLPLLVLGHHGSQTSTSEELLDHLPNLKEAVASARKARYGHPHLDVLARLTRRGVAVLRTEEWGSIHFEWPRETDSATGSVKGAAR